MIERNPEHVSRSHHPAVDGQRQSGVEVRDLGGAPGIAIQTVEFEKGSTCAAWLNGREDSVGVSSQPARLSISESLELAGRLQYAASRKIFLSHNEHDEFNELTDGMIGHATRSVSVFSDNHLLLHFGSVCGIEESGRLQYPYALELSDGWSLARPQKGELSPNDFHSDYHRMEEELSGILLGHSVEVITIPEDGRLQIRLEGGFTIRSRHPVDEDRLGDQRTAWTFGIGRYTTLAWENHFVIKRQYPSHHPLADSESLDLPSCGRKEVSITEAEVLSASLAGAIVSRVHPACITLEIVSRYGSSCEGTTTIGLQSNAVLQIAGTDKVPPTIIAEADVQVLIGLLKNRSITSIQISDAESICLRLSDGKQVRYSRGTAPPDWCIIGLPGEFEPSLESSTSSFLFELDAIPQTATCQRCEKIRRWHLDSMIERSDVRLVARGLFQSQLRKLLGKRIRSVNSSSIQIGPKLCCDTVTAEYQLEGSVTYVEPDDNAVAASSQVYAGQAIVGVEDVRAGELNIHLENDLQLSVVGDGEFEAVYVVSRGEQSWFGSRGDTSSYVFYESLAGEYECLTDEYVNKLLEQLNGLKIAPRLNWGGIESGSVASPESMSSGDRVWLQWAADDGYFVDPYIMLSQWVYRLPNGDSVSGENFQTAQSCEDFLNPRLAGARIVTAAVSGGRLKVMLSSGGRLEMDHWWEFGVRSNVGPELCRVALGEGEMTFRSDFGLLLEALRLDQWYSMAHSRQTGTEKPKPEK